MHALIAHDGPISVERFMELALGHPTFGYYVTRDPFGANGDFVTAPEISQMFGELLGAWTATVWEAMGAPAPLRLVELGPGRGTLMTDLLRMAHRLAPFEAALDIHLVETSPVLREAQRGRLAGLGVPIAWHETFATVPGGPTLVLANEFFDALPVRHYCRTPAGWCERLVGLSDGALVFGVSARPEPALKLHAPDGSLLELGVVARRVAAEVARRVVREGGAALVVDYGYTAPRLGETLQAIKTHRFVDPLAEPGSADMTAHVNFSDLGRAAREAGAAVHGPIGQGAFLRALGIGRRAQALQARATPDQAEAIDAALTRLVDRGTAERPGMGELFKVIAFSAPSLPALPGFALPPGTS